MCVCVCVSEWVYMYVYAFVCVTICVCVCLYVYAHELLILSFLLGIITEVYNYNNYTSFHNTFILYTMYCKSLFINFYLNIEDC